MKVVVTIAALDLEHGGPPRTVPALCRALARLGADVELITISEGRDADPAAKDELFKLNVIPTRSDRYHSSSWRATFRETLARVATSDSNAVIYDAGLWLPGNHLSARTAARTRTPLVVSPRGMLSARALRVSGLKKKIAWRLYQARDLRMARVLHATSEAEAEDFRAAGLKQPIAVIPNGVEIPATVTPRAPANSHIRTLLFLSRLHPIKGLADLVTAWARVRPEKWRAVIAGPDENNYRREIEQMVREHQLQTHFEFVGPANEARKWELLARADLFALPSYSESFGLVIAEALASGLPVITTRATPWSEIETGPCGWWIAPGVDSLAQALREATTSADSTLKSMGQRGREMVHQNYSWGSAGEKMTHVFEWLLDGGETPQCVQKAL